MPEGIVDGLFPATVHAVTEIVLEDPPGRVVSPPVFGGLEVASAVSAQPENPLTGGPLNPQQVSINDGALLNGVPGEMIVIATGDRSANPHVRCLVFAVSEATDPASYEGNLKTSAIFAMVSNHTAPDTRSDYGTHYRDRCLNDGWSHVPRDGNGRVSITASGSQLTYRVIAFMRAPVDPANGDFDVFNYGIIVDALDWRPWYGTN
jgi:hypothetical protein